MTSRFKTVVVTMSTFVVVLLLMGAVLGKSASPDGAYPHLGVFTEVLTRIKSEYVEEPNLPSVTLGAINGLLESVDPFASYLNAEQYKEYLKTRDLHKGSVGLVLSKKYGYIGVVDAVPGSPAAKAGLTTGDMIDSIKGVSTRDMPLAYAELLLKGKPGTAVEVSLLAMRNPEPKKLTLTRALVQYPPVTHKLLADQIGYIQVESLIPGRAKEVGAAAAELQKQGAKRLILDLRHCGTGTPDEGILLADLFLDNGLLTYVEGQRQARKNFEATAANTVSRLPMVVITNRGTASGAEVAAAALLESKRAEVVGERSYGDAAVRQPIEMDDGGAIILSVAKFYSPSGKAIQDTGVTPSVPMVETEPGADLEEEEEAPRQPEAARPPAGPVEDNLLKKAIEVVTKGAAQAGDSTNPGASRSLPNRGPGRDVPPLTAPSPRP
jgi:carboxyl-terminal processing protease